MRIEANRDEMSSKAAILPTNENELNLAVPPLSYNTLDLFTIKVWLYTGYY